MFTDMRRADRLLSPEETWAILQKGEYGILATMGQEGYPYAVPLSYAVQEGKLYFHCATGVGSKLENIRSNEKVCFTVVGTTQVMPEKFGTKYESVVIFGKVQQLQGEAKQQALEGLIDKYSAQFREGGLSYIKNAFEKTAAYEISIEHITGKARKK